jgi:hypothetical protein
VATRARDEATPAPQPVRPHRALVRRRSLRPLVGSALIALALLGGAALAQETASADEATPAAGEETETEIPCEGDSYQPLPTPPEDPQPGTLVPGPANPAPHYTKPTRKPPKHRHHHKPRHRHHRGGRR